MLHVSPSYHRHRSSTGSSFLDGSVDAGVLGAGAVVGEDEDLPVGDGDGEANALGVGLGAGVDIALDLAVAVDDEPVLVDVDRVARHRHHAPRLHYPVHLDGDEVVLLVILPEPVVDHQIALAERRAHAVVPHLGHPEEEQVHEAQEQADDDDLEAQQQEIVPRR